MPDLDPEPAAQSTVNVDVQPGGSNQKPPAIQVPIPPTRDPHDPLDIAQLASEELTARQLLQEADRIIATVRPEYFNEYRPLISQLATNYKLYQNYSAWAEFDYNRADQYMKDIAALSLPGLEGVQARDSARKAVGDSWRLWWSVYALFKAFAERYSALTDPSRNLVEGVTQPSATPPMIV